MSTSYLVEWWPSGDVDEFSSREEADEAIRTRYPNGVQASPDPEAGYRLSMKTNSWIDAVTGQIEAEAQA